ncbi:MAG: type II toxin-antitoxin system VapC family toxin [Solirubrobacterales bacterium]|nr:type II toxin-antitoxin system VapC family toxin [Solirubrobacterales bacterium]
MTVIDSSGVVDLLLGGGAAEEVHRLLRHEDLLAAPDVLVFEVIAVLRRSALRGDIEERRARAAVDDLADTPIELFPSLSLRSRAWALRHNFTVADALFVALAEQVGEPIATKDAPLAAAVARHTGVPVVRLRAAAS